MKRVTGTATAALIGASVVILFLAAFGHLIKSFKYGEVEMLLRQAKTAHELGDDVAREAFVGAALRTAGVHGLSEDIEVASDAYAHRNAVLNALKAASPGLDVKYVNRPVRGLVIAGDTAVGVHMRAGVKKVAALGDRLLDKDLRADGRRLDGLLLAVRKDPAYPRLEPARLELQEALGIPVRVVGWRSGDSPERLAQALDDLLADARAERS